MDGILVVDKPQGMTSHDVVDLIRRRFGLKKVGHAGTLDPMATGVLVMLIGRYTRSSDSLMSEEKEYDATLTLGGRSDTGDAWGKIEASGEKTSFSSAELAKVFTRFTGEIEQKPPMYSAVKFKGKKLYELARKGLSVEMSPRRIVIKRLDIGAIALPDVSFLVTCSKGTYIRQLCVDMGEALGCGGYLSRLERTRSGAFTISQAIKVDALKALNGKGLSERLLTL
jgi:tRNA pseudouridine55 synthase